MNELELAKGVASGKIDSPASVPMASYYLLDLRITGTGYAFREKADSYVLRPADEYLTEEVLAMCNGLPVTMEHPENAAEGITDESEIIGSVFYPYIKSNEVWAVCKIWNIDALEQIINNNYSTSCSFRAASTSIEVDGTEVKKDLPPQSANHVAILANTMGVWDKCNINAIAINTTETETMAEITDETAAPAATNDNGSPVEQQILKVLSLIVDKLDVLTPKEAAPAPEAAAPAEAQADPAIQAEKVEDDAETETDAPSIEEHEERIKALEGAGIKDDSEAEKEAEIMDDSQIIAGMLGTKVLKPFVGEKSTSLRRRVLKSHISDMKAMGQESAWAGTNIDAVDDSTLTEIYRQVTSAMRNIKPSASADTPIRSMIKKSTIPGIPDTTVFAVHDAKAYLSGV